MILLIQKSPHSITIFASAKLRFNTKKKLIKKKNDYNSNDDDNIDNDNDNSNNGKNAITIIIVTTLFQ